MSKVNNKLVDYACAHGTIFVPDLGQFGPTLETKSAGSRVKSMEIDEPFLLLTIEDKSKKLFTIPVPLANISHARLSETNSK